MMKIGRDSSQLLCTLLLCVISQVSCQPCSGPCKCPPIGSHCLPGIPMMLDSCGCCQVCARQEGESCSTRLPCDTSKGLQCDYSTSFPEGLGRCVGQNELGCEIGGRRLEEGQVFQPSCAWLCQCLGGGLTCVPLCSDDLQMPPDPCPNPQLMRLPGRCCKEWVCGSSDNSITSNPSATEQRQDFGGGLSRPLQSNCIEWSSEWSPCSHSCGPGVSTRTTNRKWSCRLQTETRLCQVRPCQTLLPGLRRLQQGSGVCVSSYSSPLPVHLEHHGCRSTRVYRPRFCALTCLEGHCCSPSHTKTVPVVFRCSHGRLSQQQVMVIESCSCSMSSCLQPPINAARSILSRL